MEINGRGRFFREKPEGQKKSKIFFKNLLTNPEGVL